MTTAKVDHYVYRDERGQNQFRVVRHGQKNFYIESYEDGKWVRGLNGKRPLLFMLPELIRGINEHQEVYVVEGEKDVNTAVAHELIATCNHGGAGKWKREHSLYLLNAQKVNIVWDKDEAGKEHALDIASSLRHTGYNGRIAFKCARSGKDLSDHFEDGWEEFELVDKRPRLKSDPEPEPISTVAEDEFLPIELRAILEISQQRGPVIRESGKPYQFNVICPSHDDHKPSLSVSLGDRGQIILKCQRGCKFEDVAAAFQITRSDLSRGHPENTHDSRVEQAIERLRITEEAKFKRHIEKARNIILLDENYRHTGREELALPDETTVDLFDKWFPSESMVLLNADRKTGKTRLCLSLARSVCDDEPFLGHYATTVPDGAKVLYLNYEMTANKFRAWMREAEFKRPENFLPLNLKGKSLPFNDESVLVRLASYCRRENVHLIIFDTQIKVMADLGVNENDNSEVTAFHMAVEQLMEVSQVPNVLLAHHIGKSDRVHGRGASRIEDGVDVIWTLAKGDKDELSGRVPRSLAGEGRDVLQEPVELVYNAETGLYTYEGISASRRTELDKVDVLVSRVLEFKAEMGRWPDFRDTWKMAHGSGTKRTALLNEAVDLGRLKKVRVKGTRAERYKVPEE